MRGFKIFGILFALGSIAMTVVSFLNWPSLGFFSLIAPFIAVAGIIFSIVGGKKAQAEGEKLGLAVIGIFLGMLATIASTVTCCTCGMIYLFFT